MHATLQKFGYPQSLLRDYTHWCALLRPAQITLGALVLCSKHDATALGALPDGAHAELKACTRDIETALMRFRPFDKINYLALMMVDPHVHFHVIPRYAKPPAFENVAFPDPGWPSLPDFKSSPTLDETTRRKLHATLLDAFAQLV
jgi:diadenosine tetraphosphate (Ap4A) HIT family hydrolase